MTTTDSSAEVDLKGAVELWGISYALLRRLLKGSYRKPGTRIRKECRVTEMRPGYHFRQDGPGRNAKFFLNKQRCEEFLKMNGYLINSTSVDAMVSLENPKLVCLPSTTWCADENGQQFERLTFEVKPSQHPIEFDGDNAMEFSLKTRIDGEILKIFIIVNCWSEREQILWGLIGTHHSIRFYCRGLTKPNRNHKGELWACCSALEFKK